VFTPSELLNQTTTNSTTAPTGDTTAASQTGTTTG